MSLIPKAVNFDEKWIELKGTLEKLITLSSVSRKAWNDHFSDVYALCVAKPQPFTERLYNETKKFLHDHVKVLLAQIQESSGDEIVAAYFSTWAKYTVGMKHLHCLLLYLNMQHVQSQTVYLHLIDNDGSKHDSECMVIGELGLEIWKNKVIVALKDTLIELLIDGILSFEILNPPDTNKSVYQGSVESFVSVEDYKKGCRLKFYQEIFELPYLKRCGKLYEYKSHRLLQDCGASKYVEKTWQLFEEEQQRSAAFLHHSSFPKVEAQFVKYMVADHLPLLREECRIMVQQEQFRNLRMMYVLLQLVDNRVKIMASELFEHIKVKGDEVVSALTEGNCVVQFVDDCVALHDKYRGIICKFFENDKCLLSALDKAMSYIVNKRQTCSQLYRSPEILAKYCDVLLKKSSKGLSDAELEEKLLGSITILKYIDDKDVFNKWYSRMLAKRLIHELSLSLDAEEAMINKLKQACGYEFTNKLRRMFTDVKLSSNMNFEFSEFLAKENIDLSLNFFIYVLQAASWPMSQTLLTPVSLCPQLENALQAFDRFYHCRFSCRKLTFLHNFSHVEVKVNYLKKCYLIDMQMFQLVILQQFETVNKANYSDLQEATQLTSEQFVKFIKSVVESKLIICADQELNASSLFHLNFNYANKRTKFRIVAANQRESVQEVVQTRTSVEEDRKLYLHAAIVRVMKSRKVLQHNTLIQEILILCKEKFTPSVSAVKKAIESLIEKQYIERTPNSQDEYSYVA